MQNEENRKAIKVAFRLLSSIENRGETSRWICLICIATNLLSILFYLVVDALEMAPPLQTSADMWNMIRLVLTVLVLVGVCGKAAVFVIEYWFFNQMGTLQQNKSILKVNGIVASVLYFLIEGVYFLGSILLIEALMSIQTFAAQDYILLIFGSILFVEQSLLVLTPRLYGRFAVLVGPLLVLIGGVIGIVLLLLLSGILIYREGRGSDDHHLRRVLYFLVGITCLWSFLQLEYASYPQNIVAFINLLLVGFSLLGVFFFSPELLGRRPTLEDNRRLLRWFTERTAGEAQGEEGEVNLQEQELYESHFLDLEHGRDVCLHQEIRNVAVVGWKEADKAQVLWERIQWTRETDNSFDTNLFYFRAGLALRTNTLSLFKELASYLDKNRNLGLARNYQIFKINQEVFRCYEQSVGANDSALQIADVVQAEKHYHHFYRQLDQLLLEMIQFWREVVANHFSINTEIELKIQGVARLQRSAKECLKRLSAHRIAEEHRLFGLVSELINGYQPTTEQKVSGRGEKAGSFEYVVVEGDQVRKISLKLLKSLGYQSSSLEVHSMRALLPANFFAYLQEVQRRFLEREKGGQWVVPIVQASGCIVLKQCVLYLVPHWGSTLQYLLSFQTMVPSSPTFILYNAVKQKVEHFSASFREFIGMNMETFKEFSRGDNVLFSTDLFQTELGTAELMQLRSHEVIKTKVIYPDFYLRKNSLYNYNDEVTLHLEHEFSFASQNYLLMSVQSESFRQARMENDQKTQSHMRALNKEKQLHQQYANQEFFCRIENPYKSKIVQKLSGIRKRTYVSYFYQIVLIKLILLFLLLANAITFNLVSQNMITSGRNQLNVMLNLNNEYIYLLRLISGTYTNFLFTNNPNATTRYLNYNYFNNSANSSTLASMAANLTSFLQDFNEAASQKLMSTYLLYKPGVDQHMQMDYKIAFAEFNITTNTMLTSFYDFIVEVQQGFSDGSAVKFLAQNYDSAMGIMPVYEQSDAFVNDYLDQYESLNIMGYAFVIILGFSIVVSFLSTLRMINVHQEMHLLYQFIDRNDVKNIIKELTHIKESVGSVAVTNDKHKRYTQLITRKEMVDSNHEIVDSQRELEGGEGSAVGGGKAADDKTCMRALYKAFKYIYFCPILFGVACLVCYLQYRNIAQDQADYKQIVTLLQKLQSDQMHLEKFYDDIFQPGIYRLYYGNYNPTYMHNVFKNEFYTDALPPIFGKDVFLDENLCAAQYTDPIQIPFFSRNIANCTNIEIGILTKGYSKGLEFYQTILRDQTKLNFTDYVSRIGGKKTNTIIFIKELLFSYLDVKKANFMNNVSAYLNINAQQDNTILILTIIGCLCLLVIMIYNISTLHQVMYVVIDLICAIPSSAMYKMAMTNYIRKEGILAKMDKL